MLWMISYLAARPVPIGRSHPLWHIVSSLLALRYLVDQLLLDLLLGGMLHFHHWWSGCWAGSLLYHTASTAHTGRTTSGVFYSHGLPQFPAIQLSSKVLSLCRRDMTVATCYCGKKFSCWNTVSFHRLMEKISGIPLVLKTREYIVFYIWNMLAYIEKL